ncbi:MAG: autotransporter domain-containing protein [Verrucomicrobia bacterium]|nr:autotransporter domain-containing protein [Verrucomicrobiota bacterium]MBV8483131.1 autotransporter domain-containing protein [Verrucomicrobiota bacterium]
MGLLLIGGAAYGQQDVWQGPSTPSSWFTNGDWSLGAPPTSSENALVDNGTTVQITSGTASAASVTVGGTVGNSILETDGGTLNISGPLTIATGGEVLFSNGFLFASSITDNGSIVFQNGFNNAFGSTISGTGSLTVNLSDGATLALSGDDTYSGQTLVEAGTLQAQSNTAFSLNSAFTVDSILDLNGFSNTIGSLSGTGIVTNGIAQTDIKTAATTTAILTVGNDNSNSLFAGVLEDGTGALGLTKIGSGVLTLTGTNTYTGGTIIDGGVLQLGNGGTTGSIVGNVADNATLAFDRSDIYTFTGVISGTGAVQQIGTGTVVLTGNNTYTGGTIIGAGTLQLGNGGTTGIITGNITNNGSLVIDLSDVFTLGGAISGTGSVRQIGAGTTVLTGNSTYTGGTIISAGTLQLGNGGTTGTITGNVANNATLAFDLSDVYIFGGLISGTGAVQQIGTGTTVLTANNTYSGGTTISRGTLQLGTGGTTGTLVGNVIDNGTLAFNRSDTFTFGGLISGTGTIQQMGTGTVILTGNNTYTGQTTIGMGTLQLGNGGTTGSIIGNVNDNGILTFYRTDAFTFSGVISGTGQVVKRGGDTLTLTGSNTYSGTTTVNGGTLQAGSAGAFSANSAFSVNPGAVLDLNGFNSTIASLSGSGTVLNSGAGAATLTVGNNNTDTIFSGVLENGTQSSTDGKVALTKVGTGALTLTGTNTYIGSTTVDNGSLVVNGSIASPQTLVESTGLLAGTGLIGGNLVNNGMVNPGDAPGTLTVRGNYTQSPSGTLSVQIAGLAPGQYSLLLVDGHASLAGTLRLTALNGFKLQVGNQLTFLIANGGVSGAFTTIENPFVSNTIVKADVVTLASSVQIVGTQGNFVLAACNPNNVSVARALNSAVGAPQASALITYLDNQPFNTLCSDDFTAISPEKLTSVYSVGISLANVESANLERRMDEIRLGSHGFDGTAFTINGGPPSFTDGLAGPSGVEGKSGPSVPAPIPENRWGFFANGLGQFIHVDGTEGASGFDLQTGGVTLGADYRIGSNFAIGLTADYAHTGVDLVDNSNIDVNSGKFGLYTTVFGNGFYLDGAVTGGWSGYDTHRTALLGNANGSTDGADLNVLVDSGYDWTKGDLNIGPTATFQYSYVGFNAFTETGSLAPLRYADQSVDSIRTSFGMKASYNWKIGAVLVKPELSAAWQHEYSDSAYSIVANFANGAGDSFAVTGPRIGRNSLLLGAGVSVLLSDRVSTYVYYDGEHGRTNYQSNAVSGGVRITF